MYFIRGKYFNLIPFYSLQLTIKWHKKSQITSPRSSVKQACSNYSGLGKVEKLHVMALYIMKKKIPTGGDLFNRVKKNHHTNSHENEQVLQMKNY